MPIIGMTDRPDAFPCIGILRKGDAQRDGKNRKGEAIKIVGRDLNYFRFDTDDMDAAKAFAFAYGPEPKAIMVYLPHKTVDQNFMAYREAYTASELKHRCDGEQCYTYDRYGVLASNGIPCPDKNKPDTDRTRCKQVGRLHVVIPVLNRFAYVTALTGSIHDIVALSQQLGAIYKLSDTLQGIPMLLSRYADEITMPKPDGTRVRVEKWMLRIEVSPQWAALRLQTMERQALQLQTIASPQLPTPIDYEAADLAERYNVGADNGRLDELHYKTCGKTAAPVSPTRPCKKCNAPIIFDTLNGKPHPYDATEDGQNSGVSHFDTCPNAQEFRDAQKAKTTNTPIRIPKPATIKSADWPQDLQTSVIGHIRDLMRQLDHPTKYITLDLETMDEDALATLLAELKEQSQPTTEH